MQTIRTETHTCIDMSVGPAYIDQDLPIAGFEEDMARRRGYSDPVWGEVTAVSIDPTLMVGANAYRGIWDIEAVRSLLCFGRRTS